jgi:hypothetical protein
MQLHLSLGIHRAHVSGDKQRMLRQVKMREDPASAMFEYVDVYGKAHSKNIPKEQRPTARV